MIPDGMKSIKIVEKLQKNKNIVIFGGELQQYDLGNTEWVDPTPENDVKIVAQWVGLLGLEKLLPNTLVQAQTVCALDTAVKTLQTPNVFNLDLTGIDEILLPDSVVVGLVNGDGSVNTKVDAQYIPQGVILDTSAVTGMCRIFMTPKETLEIIDMTTDGNTIVLPAGYDVHGILDGNGNITREYVSVKFNMDSTVIKLIVSIMFFQ